MSLAPATCAQNITTGYFNQLQIPMSNNKLDYGDARTPTDGDLTFNSMTYRTAFANAYVAYALQGQVSGTALIPSTPGPGIIIAGLVGGTPSSLASAFATFWAGSFLGPPGPPTPGDLLKSAENDAAGKVSAFKGAIMNTITDQFSPPFYKNLIDNIQGVVETITWSCIDIKFTPSGPIEIPYTGTIS